MYYSIISFSIIALIIGGNIIVHLKESKRLKKIEEELRTSQDFELDSRIKRTLLIMENKLSIGKMATGILVVLILGLTVFLGLIRTGRTLEMIATQGDTSLTRIMTYLAEVVSQFLVMIPIILFLLICHYSFDFWSKRLLLKRQLVILGCQTETKSNKKQESS